MEFVYFLFSVIVGFVVGLPVASVIIRFSSSPNKDEDLSSVPRLCPVVGDECPKSEGYNDCEHCSIFRG